MRFRCVTISLAALALFGCGQATEDTAGIAPTDQPTASDEVEPVALGTRPKSFSQCATCHSVEPTKNGIGPSLAGVFEAKAAHVGDFAYSSAMRQSGLTWDEATLDRYLENPRKAVPGTKMSFNGTRNAEQRAQIIEYLKTL